jgi:hypothetical protein
MSFYNTGNPVPSIDPRDLDDNAKHVDELVNSTLPTFVDRLGSERRTLAGIEADADAIVLRDELADPADPNKGAGMVGWVRSVISGEINTAGKALSANPVNLWEKQFVSLITNKPTPADPSTWDWTPAVEAAAATGRAVFVPRVPLVFYRIGDADIPAGTLFIGESVPRYTVAATADVKGESCFVKFGSATALIRGLGLIESHNILFHGDDKTGTIYRHSSTLVHIRHVSCGCYGFDRAIGKNEAIGGFVSTNSSYANNNVGINNILDSMLVNNFINANTLIGVNLGTGANDNTFIGNKYEFNGTNLSTAGAVDNNFIGGVFDRAGTNNILVGVGAEISIAGVQNTRAGSSGSGSNLTITGASRVVVTGMITKHGFDDGGGGLDTPTINVDISGACGLVVLSGCDLTGVNGTTKIRRQAGTTFSVGLRVDGCPSVPDVISDGLVSVAASGGISTIPINLPSLTTFSARLFYLDLTSRNNTSGAVTTARLAIAQIRGSGSAVLTEQAKVFQQSAGFFDAAAGSVTYAFTSVATDGSSFTLSLTNNTADVQVIAGEIRN